MSTERYKLASGYTVPGEKGYGMVEISSHWGGEFHGPCIQLTVGHGGDCEYVVMKRHQVKHMRDALNRFLEDTA